MTRPALTERRCDRRHERVDEHGVLSGRIRLGSGVTIRNVSASGALLESSDRLLPGATIELLLMTRSGRSVVKGRVVRCLVTHVSATALVYRAAICFAPALRLAG